MHGDLAAPVGKQRDWRNLILVYNYSGAEKPRCSITINAQPLDGLDRSAEMMARKDDLHKIASRFLLILLITTLFYLGLGLGFHLAWKSALTACKEAKMARGEFVEPEVFGGILGLAFDVTFWPVYSWANIYHDGTPFATPCTH
jgi:hypothetical protein